MRPGRIRKAAIVLKPATLTKFRRALLSRNYHGLFSSHKNAKPGPKGPSYELVRVIVELKLLKGRGKKELTEIQVWGNGDKPWFQTIFSF